MDIVLEFTDTYFFDALYAKAFPASAPALVDLYLAAEDGNSTSLRVQAMSAWTYRPASRYLYLEPSKMAYMSQWPRDNPYRQFLNLYIITLVFAYVLYFLSAPTLFYFFFDKSALKHPKFRKNQIRQEIYESLLSIPWMSLFTIPVFLLDVRGYSKMYEYDGSGLWYEILQFPLFVMVTDAMNYWIHRTLHHPFFYKTLHKQHHKFIVATPFAGYAFHPLDGFAQSIPYHVFIFVFPLDRWQYLPIWVVANLWTLMIHEGDYVSDSKILNSPACHTVHHVKFFYNFGQLFTLWDRVFGTYRNPYDELELEDKNGTKKLKASSVMEVEQDHIVRLWEARGKRKVQ